jgi:hypothetical protein
LKTNFAENSLIFNMFPFPGPPLRKLGPPLRKLGPPFYFWERVLYHTNKLHWSQPLNGKACMFDIVDKIVLYLL